MPPRRLVAACRSRLCRSARGRRPGLRGAPADPRPSRRPARVRQARLRREHAARVPRGRAARLRARARREADAGPRAGGDPRRRRSTAPRLHRAGSSAHTLADLRANCPSTSSAPTTTSSSSARSDRSAHRFPSWLRRSRSRATGRPDQPRDQEHPDRPGLRQHARLRRRRVIDAIKAAGFPPSRLIIQSLLVPEPDRRAAAAARRRDLLLTLGRRQRRDRRSPRRRGYDWVSPAFPLDADYVTHGARARPARGPVHARHARGDRRGGHGGRGRADHERPAARPQDRGARSTRSRPPIPPPPSAPSCRAARASRTLGDDRGLRLEAATAPRVFAMQPKQEARHVRQLRDASGRRSSA